MGDENRKSSTMSSPREASLACCVLMRIHTDFVSSGAYKQIIGALVIRKKIHEYTSALFKLNQWGGKSDENTSKLLIVYIVVVTQQGWKP